MCLLYNWSVVISAAYFTTRLIYIQCQYLSISACNRPFRIYVLKWFWRLQWCTFPSVSGHRPITIPRDRFFQPPSGPWSDQSTVQVVSSPIIFTMPRTNLPGCYCFPADFKPQGSAKHRPRLLTSVFGLQGHHRFFSHGLFGDTM